MSRIAIVFLCAAAVFVGPAAAAQAGTSTQLPFGPSNETWLAVDPVGQHVFVSGGRGTSSIVVLDFNGNIVKTITGEPGASQMAVDPATHTLYCSGSAPVSICSRELRIPRSASAASAG
jgi:DNA-binding beta-propeller fold protein YncE